MKHNLLKFLLLSAILFSASSCRKPGQHESFPPVIYYKIINNSDSRIKVFFYSSQNNYWPATYVNDSIDYFKPGEGKPFLVVYYDQGSYYQSENKDTLQGIRVLKIFRSDTIPLQKNFRLRKYWVSEKTNTYKSELTLEITNEDF